MSELVFADGESLNDLGTLVSRAQAIEPGGAIRLQVQGTTLAAWVCALAGRGVLGQGVVLGLRVMPLEVVGALDETVPLAAVTDRLARRRATGDASTTLALPPTTVRVPWTALTPPRGPWEPVGEVAGDDIVRVARDGIAQVAGGTPEGGAGSHAVQALRTQVWSATAPWGLPAGTAFGAYALGFVRESGPGNSATVFRCGPWSRLSTPSGHILTR